jgi:hypothetical protein
VEVVALILGRILLVVTLVQTLVVVVAVALTTQPITKVVMAVQELL